MSDLPSGSFTPPPPPMAPPPPGGGDIVYPSTPAKEPILILVLNILLGGVGYIVMGQMQKGIAALVGWLLGFVLCGIPSVIIALVAAIDGFLQAQQLQQGHPVGQWTFFNTHK